MQATQSTNAQGKRTFPSPFTAPIQAARRLMDRQRQDEERQERPEDSANPLHSSDAHVSNAELPDGSLGLTGAWRGEIRYDEASIVASLDAGLEFAETEPDGLGESPDEGDRGLHGVNKKGLDQDANIGRSGLLPAEQASGYSTQTEGRPLAALGPDLRWDRGPDPGAVRAAISRLARESQARESQGRESKGRESQGLEPQGRGAAAFADVARRVWEEEVHTKRAAAPLPEDRTTGAAVPSGIAAGAMASAAELAVPGEASAFAGTRIAGETAAAGHAVAAVVVEPVVAGPAVAELFVAASGIASAGDSGIEPFSGSALSDSISSDSTSPSPLPAGPIETVRSKETVASETIVPSVLDHTTTAGSAPSTTRFTTARFTEEECLAHDAGNLFTAMRLYSELLCISGVLQERHRHYAEDLKLLATRSQGLIDRLLKLGERLGEARNEAQNEDRAEDRIAEDRIKDHSEAKVEAEADGLGDDALAGASPQASFAAQGSSEAARVEDGTTYITAQTDRIHRVDRSIVDRLVVGRPLVGRPNVDRFTVDRLDNGDRSNRLEREGRLEDTDRTGLEIAAGATDQADQTDQAEQKTGPEATDVAATLERMGNLLQTIARGALTIDLGSNAALPVEVGIEPLERILVNLVCNATAAVQGGGAIRIRAGVRALAQDRSKGGVPAQHGGSQPGRTMVLTVDDSGCGMSAEQIRGLLEGRVEEIESRFRADAASREDADTKKDATKKDAMNDPVNLEAGRSSLPLPSLRSSSDSENRLNPERLQPVGRGRRGLGLRIVRELVAASGGRLFIQSQPGVGTRIEIHWQTLTPAPSLLHPASPANLSRAPLPLEVADPAVRRPAAVSRIRAGSVIGDEGAVAC